MLSKLDCSAVPRTKIESKPVSAPPGKSTRKIDPQAPRGVRDVEIDPGNVGKVIAVLMTLEKEVAAVVVAWRRPARVAFKDKVSILVRLSFSRFDRLRRKIIEIAKLRDYARWVLKRVGALGDLDEGELVQDSRVGMTDALVR